VKKRFFKRLGGKRRGFTLIELLIVLSILAVLAAVVVLALTGFIGRGKAEACKTDERSLQTAVYAWYYENPANTWPCATQPTAAAPQPIDWDVTYTDPGPDGDIDTAGDNITYAFMPDYVGEIPGTDATCTWSLNAKGNVCHADAATLCKCSEACTPPAP
jgi:prepilin-type N-terminal cleavage/methylation domain-containing protein